MRVTNGQVTQVSIFGDVELDPRATQAPAPTANGRLEVTGQAGPTPPGRVVTSRWEELVLEQQHRRGPHRVRTRYGLMTLLVLVLAIWSPLLLAGGPHPSLVALLGAGALGAYLAGLGVNGAVLYRLARGRSPTLGSASREPTGRRGWLLAVPAAAAVVS